MAPGRCWRAMCQRSCGKCGEDRERKARQRTVPGGELQMWRGCVDSDKIVDLDRIIAACPATGNVQCRVANCACGEDAWRGSWTKAVLQHCCLPAYSAGWRAVDAERMCGLG